MPGRDDAEPGWRDEVTRPGLLIGYAALAMVGAVVLLGVAVSGMGPAWDMVRAPVCSDSAACLVPRTLDGLVSHQRRKSFGSEWQEASGDIPVSDTRVDVSFLGSRQLRADRRAGAVTGLFWHGRLVAFQGVDGDRVTSDDYGSRAWVIPLTVALGTLAAAYIAVMSAVAKRRRTGSWWRLAGPAGWLPTTPQTIAVVVVIGWGLATLTSLDVGASVWLAEVINLVLFGTVVLVGWREHRRHPRRLGRHAAPDQPG